MKGWLLATAVMIVMIVFVSVISLRSCTSPEAGEKEHEAEYESALRSYSKNYPTGLTRKVVEARLRAGGSSVVQMCCVQERSALADRVTIEKKPAGWPCSESYVYIAFEFAATEPHNSLIAFDTDRLKRVSVFRQLGGCL